MIRAIFLATTAAAGAYWARQWGYKPHEVRIVVPPRIEGLRGLRWPMPVFFCGPLVSEIARPALEDALELLYGCGVEVMNAHEVGGERRSPLWG